MKIFITICVIVVVAYLIKTSQTRPNAKNFSDHMAIRAIVGEYAVADLYGMKLFAHAIRNRGTLQGVYGVSAPHIYRESHDIWNLAKKAWALSEHERDPLHGANSWYSFADVQKHGHPKDAKIVKLYNGTYFYKITRSSTGRSKK